MADEVTKKDLQSLQGTFNKKFNENETRLVKAEGQISILKDLPTDQDNIISKLVVDVNNNLLERIAALKVAVDDLKKK